MFAHISTLRRDRGLTILLVEQNTQRALQLADRAYVVELGRIVGEGPPQQLLADRTLLDAYLGTRGRAATLPARPSAPVEAVGIATSTP